MSEEASVEFDLYEDARQRLTETLIESGRTPLDAERIALYVVQGIRGVPLPVSLLTREDAPAVEQLHKSLREVLDNAYALEKAKALLLGDSEHKSA